MSLKSIVFQSNVTSISNTFVYIIKKKVLIQVALSEHSVKVKPRCRSLICSYLVILFNYFLCLIQTTEVMGGSLAGGPKMASGNGQTTQICCSITSLPCALLFQVYDEPLLSITPSYSRKITSGDMWPLDLFQEWATSVKT